jgi:hypothetical protein
MFLNAALNPNVEWMLPAGDVPFIPNEAPDGTEHTRLSSEMRTVHNYVKLHRDRLNMPEVLGNPGLNSARREMMFIQLLEGLHQSEADLLIVAKDKKLSRKYKGLTANAVQEAYEWNEHFEPKEAPRGRGTRTSHI